MTHAQRTRRRRRGSGGPRNKAFLALMVAGIVIVLAGLGGVGYIVSIAASAPPLSSLKPKATAENTRVFAADGRPLGFIQADDLHLPLRSSDIPQVVKDATIAIEDERFYKHKGVDYEGLVRAAFKNVTSGQKLQGGSTITMQLARSLYISNERTYTRKIREAKLAEELEDEHSKEWILEKYLDSIPYGTVGGQSAIGIKAAARIYFSKNLKDLNVQQAALLAGLPQAPSDYSPTRSRNAAKTRRNEVLRKMEELGMITPAEADAAVASKLGLKRSSYFSKRREEYFFDYVKDQLFREYGAQTVRAGGMKVFTTIDLRKQAEARDTISDHLAGVGPSSAIVTIDPRNGYIEAMASSGD
ncbi:MAG TPA: transglycosylase domain-containing protein, partial [Solirubrobacteraceae bacterium]|nr:transglycosylase domain-containing protein [Solirubrobacteraceae bacterium]